jgi:hypothetical protein
VLVAPLLLLTTSSRPENIFSHANEAGGHRAPDLNAPLNQICAHCWLLAQTQIIGLGERKANKCSLSPRFISFRIHNFLLHLQGDTKAYKILKPEAVDFALFCC